MGNRKKSVGSGKAPVCRMDKLSKLLDVAATGEGEWKQEAEQEIQKLEATRVYPVHLTQIILEPNCRVEVRILASTKLKKIVEAHWCSTAKSFVPPEIDSKTKEKIKTLLHPGLSEYNKEVRKAVADVISTIVACGWLNNWAGLIEILVIYLNEESELGLHGGLLVLRKIVFQRTDVNLANSCSVILREMNRIFATERYSIEVRCLALEVFSKIVSSVSLCTRQDFIQCYLQPAVSLFCESSIPCWTSENSHGMLKTNILRVIVMLIKHLPKCVGDLLSNMLPLFWQTLIDSVKDYQSTVVNRIGSNDKRVVSADTKPGEADYHLEDLIKAILEFILYLASGEDRYCLNIDDYQLLDYEWSYLQDSFVPPQALRHLIMLMETTEEEIELWKTDVDNLVRKEFWIFPCDGVRRTTEDLIEFIVDKNRAIANGLVTIIMQHLRAENAIRLSRQSGVSLNSWKSHEALLLAFGLIKESIMPEKEGGHPRYNVVPVFKNIILPNLNNTASHPLLVGRCLCLGGTYADLIPPEMASAFLKATANHLQDDQPACIRVCAAKAVYLWYHPDNSSKDNETDKIRRSYIPALFKGLYSLAQSRGSARVIKLVLKSVAALMPFHKTFTASVAGRIYLLAETALPEYCTTSVDCHPCLDVFEKLPMSPECVQLLQERLIPTLLRMMTDAPSDKPNTSKAVAEIIEVLVEHSSAPLSKLVTNTLLPGFCKFLVRAENSGSLSVGILGIHTFLVKALQQVQNKDRRCGAQHILKVIVVALNQKCEIEKACEIVISLIKEAWQKMEEDMEELLEALLIYMQNDKSSVNKKKLIMVYAHLIHAQPDNVLNFLARAPRPEGQKSPLEFVISEGFYGNYYYPFFGEARKILKLAFGKILEYAVTNLSSPLHQIAIIERYSSVTSPLLVEIWKLAMRDKG